MLFFADYLNGTNSPNAAFSFLKVATQPELSKVNSSYLIPSTPRGISLLQRIQARLMPMIIYGNHIILTTYATLFLKEQKPLICLLIPRDVTLHTDTMIIGTIWSGFNLSFGMRVKYMTSMNHFSELPK